jgi:hypothetical protein
MAFNEQEKQLIAYGRANGKTQAEVTQALVNMRAGVSPPAPQPAAQNSTLADLAIGAAKGLGQTLETVGAQNAGPVGADMLAHAPAFKQNIEDAKAALHATNKTQQVGKAAELAAEFVSPFVAARLAGLTAKTATLVPKTGSLLETVKEGASALKNSVQVAFGKKAANPQLEASANRLYLEGAQRVGNPVERYDKFVNQSKAALTDIKADPPIAEVGGHIGDAFNQVVKQRRAVGQTMGEELKKVGGIKTNITDAYTNLETALKDADLTYNGRTKKIIPGSASKMTAEDTSLLESYISELNKLGAEPTVAQIDATIARTQGLVNNFKSAKGITETTNAERLIKASQNALRDQLNPAKSGNKALAKYAEARAAYSDLSDFIDEGASYLGNVTQSGDFAKDASLAKSSVQSILNNGKKDWLIKLEEKTGYPAMDDAVLALQAMKDAGDFRGLSLLQTLSEGSIPTSKAGITQKMIDFAIEHASRVVAGTPEEQTRAFLNALKEAAHNKALQ